MPAAIAPAIDRPDIRSAGRDLLSLAWMDARNHTLQLLSAFEQACAAAGAPCTGFSMPLWLAGRSAWLAECWISRNPQRALGRDCAALGVQPHSAEPRADGWFGPRRPDSPAAPTWEDAEAVKAYLLDTLEAGLEALESATEDDAGLYFFRFALHLEDRCGEQIATLAQSEGVPLALDFPAGAQPREALGLPATRWPAGWRQAGFALDIEQGAEDIAVPEFEIDAQPVSWAQFVEFIDDGGYDRPELWQPAGWDWLQSQAATEGRRGPRYVEQIGIASGAVMQTLFGRPRRMGALQSVLHASWWEADAFAHWCGRRLPTEAEWEIAATTAARRGFRWGDVLEWTAGTLRPFSGFRPDPWSAPAGLDATPLFGRARVLRGASFAARARAKHPKARAWALPHEDEGFVGFRTCAV